MRARLVLLTIGLLLGGCSYFAAPGFQFGREPALHYYERVSGLGATERQAELAHLETLSDPLTAVTTAVSIAVLVGLHENANAEDEAYALTKLEILEDVVPTLSERNYYQLGLLVREFLFQRRALREARQIHADLQQHVENLQQQIEELRSGNLLLQSQIEALKNIETQINERAQQENIDGAINN